MVPVSVAGAFAALAGVVQPVLNVTRVYKDAYLLALKGVYTIWMREDVFVIHYTRETTVLKVNKLIKNA